MLYPSGSRFADTQTWMIDVNDYGAKFHDILHVVSATPKATGSVCDAFGNRVELKNIPELLHKLSRGQFKLAWSESFCARDHVALERLDSSMSWPEMTDLLLDANKVRGEAWAAVSPTGVGTYLNV